MRAAAASLDRRLGVEGDTEAGSRQHRNVIGAVADRKRGVASEPETRAQCVERLAAWLPGRAPDRPPRRSACRRHRSSSVLA